VLRPPPRDRHRPPRRTPDGQRPPRVRRQPLPRRRRPARLVG